MRNPMKALATRRRALTVAGLSLALAALTGAATSALAGNTPAKKPQGPQQVVIPGDPQTSGQRPAVKVQQAQTGQGWMEHPLMAAVRGWKSTTPQLAAAAPTGLDPARLRSYLNLTGTGRGQTVAVVVAFDNPSAQADLTTFSTKFGLPLPCEKKHSNGCFDFSVQRPLGGLTVNDGWALESDLDVQTVHAVAPDASIVLVEAPDNSYAHMLSAIDYAAGLHASVISNSWGGAEFAGENAGDGHCALSAALCVFATGDSGNPGSYPAYNPYALAVGGTTVGLDEDGDVDFEAGWCCTTGATGGGVSSVEPRPAYQSDVNSYQGRGIPDVSFDADPVTGLPVYDSVAYIGQTGWFQVGGTSAGAPAWAGILAAADELRAKDRLAPLSGAGHQAQQLIYGMPHDAFRDITVGASNLTQCTSAVESCRAHTGFDLVTGWGSPRHGIDAALAAR